MSTELRVPFLQRLAPGHWMAIDFLVAAVLAVLYRGGAREWALLHSADYWPWHIAAAVVPVPLAVRRLWPGPVLAVTLAGSVLLLLNGAENDPLVAVSLALYMVAARMPAGRAIAALTLVLLTIGSVAVTVGLNGGAGVDGRPDATLAHATSAIVFVAAAWTIGFALRQWRVYTAGLEEQAERRGRARVAEERLRIARDLHDVVAHSMSLIAVQAGVANYVIDQQPGEAARALISIEGTSRAALVEMRRLLGVLRDTDGSCRDPKLEPAPDLTDLEELVARTAQAGVRVQVQVRGRPQVVSPAVELAAYRIVQEALTNVIKHANTDAGRVVVTYAEDELAVEITDEGRGGTGAGDGHGITGMRERVGLFGGRFEAAERPVRGFRVMATLPLNGTSS